MEQIPSSERRVVFPPDVWRSAVYYMHDERLRLKTKEAKDSMTTDKLLIEVVRNHLENMGHYPPKDEVEK
jgi:hypothetical protein